VNEIAENLARHPSAQIIHVTVLYNGIPKRVEIDPDATVKTLLERAIALFGNLPQPHTLALWTEKGVELTNERETLKAAHVEDGDSLILRPSSVKGG
jgi:hypothetical protein